MEQQEFKYRLSESTKMLIECTQSMVTDSISKNVEYLIEPNIRDASKHLNERELDKLKQLNQLGEHLCNTDEVVALLNDLGLVPLWINLEVNRSTKKQTIVKLICSRRLRNGKDLNDLVDQFPPFHPVVPSPPWHKEGDKFNVNWKHQRLKIKWHALTWKWRYEKELKKAHHNTA